MSEFINRNVVIDAINTAIVPKEFKTDERLMQFMNNKNIADFGKMQWENGFNTGMIAARVAAKAAVNSLPSTQIGLKDAIRIIWDFLNSAKSKSYYTATLETEDGEILETDWGYFEMGLNEIERYVEKRKNG